MNNQVHVREYAEFTDDPRTWNSPEPAFDLEKFNKRLAEVGGRSGSRPRYRCRWAGKLPEYLIEDFDEQTGWTWREDGVDKFASVKDGEAVVPRDAIVAPFYENFKVFTPRYVIEELRSDGIYQFLCWIETVEKVSEEFGRVNLLSRYREPSQIDLDLVKAHRYQRDHLSAGDIQKGLDAQKMRTEKEKLSRREEFVDQCAEDFVEAITDGIPNAKEIDEKVYSPDYIREYSKALMEKHNAAI